jgi:hypothetical protein
MEHAANVLLIPMLVDQEYVVEEFANRLCAHYQIKLSTWMDSAHYANKDLDLHLTEETALLCHNA